MPPTQRKKRETSSSQSSSTPQKKPIKKKESTSNTPQKKPIKNKESTSNTPQKKPSKKKSSKNKESTSNTPQKKPSKKKESTSNTPQKKPSKKKSSKKKESTSNTPQKKPSKKKESTSSTPEKKISKKEESSNEVNLKKETLKKVEDSSISNMEPPIKTLSPKIKTPNTIKVKEDEIIKEVVSEEKYKDEPSIPFVDKENYFAPNDPFVLHFLLDGFISSHIGNNTSGAIDSFIAMLTALKTDWATNMVTELKRGSKYGPLSGIHSQVLEKGQVLSKLIEKQANKIDDEELKKNMIVSGGYISSGGNGHATAFRFLPKEKKIIFTNTGEGLNTNHYSVKEEKKQYYDIYRVWQFNTKDEYRIYGKKILAAVSSPYIDTIELSYQYQVNITDIEDFRSILKLVPGVSSVSNELWMTNSNNWMLDDITKKICFLPQIAGSCTFHSIFWQLLLDKWHEKGYTAAEKLERDCRNIILDKLLVIAPSKNYEEISCLSLIVGTYHNFKRRNLALDVLASRNTTNYDLTEPEVSDELPSEAQNAFSYSIESLCDLVKQLNKVKDINSCAMKLVDLMKNIYSYFDDISNNADNSKKKEQQLFLFAIIHIMTSAIKHINKLSATLHKDIALLYNILISFKIFKNIHTNLWKYQNTFISFPETSSLFLGIFAKLYQSYEGNKLPPHNIPYNNAAIMFEGKCDCLTIDYIKNYIHYSYQFGIKNDDPRVNVWKKYTSKKPTGALSLFIIDTSLPTTKVYDSFTKSSLINELVAASFLIFLKTVNNGYSDPYGAWTLVESTISNIADLQSVKKELRIRSETLGLIKDLDSGVPIELLKYGKSTLPYLYPEIAFNCDIKLNNMLISNRPVVNGELFHIYENKWMKKVWTKTLSQVPGIVSNKRLLKLCCLWLFYLFPKGKHNIDLFKFPIINKEDPLLTLMLEVWLGKGDVEALIIEMKKLYTKLKTALDYNTSTTSKKLYTFLLFNETLFYRWDILLPLLTALNTSKKLPEKIKGKKGFIRLQYPSHWPNYLRILTWNHNEVVKYKKNRKSLVYCPQVLDSWMASLNIKCHTHGISTALWKKKDSTLQLELYIDNDIFTITKDKFITPIGEVYNLILPNNVPICMKQWCEHYKSCFTLPLVQIEDKIEKYYFFMAGVDTFTVNVSVFDKDKGNATVFYEPTWFIFSMKTNLIMPVLNRDTPGWYFLVAHLIDSVKLNCIGLIRPLLISLFKDDANIPNTYRYIKIQRLIIDFNNLGDSDRRYSYYEKLKTSFVKYPDYGDTEYRLWYAICSSIIGIHISEHIVYLYNIVCSRLKKKVLPKRLSQMLFEVMSGLLLRPEQEDLLSKMWNDLVLGNATIRTSLMGSGKSTVLVPMLVILSLFNDLSITVIQPEHLVSQTLAILDEIIPFLFTKNNYSVISDVTAKKDFLISIAQGTYIPDPKLLYLFDEIDNMYRPDKSEFNIPDGRKPHPIDSLPMKDYYSHIVNLIYDEVNIGIKLKYFPEFLAKVANNLTLVRKLDHHLDYGLSDNENEYIAVPYSAVNTPVPGATFSDIDVAALATCLIRKKDGLVKRDFFLLKFQLIRWKQIAMLNDIFGYNIDSLLKLGNEVLVEKYGKDASLQKLYLSQVLLPLKLYSFSRQYNISFIDLMGPSFSKRRIGFSGTNLIHLPDFSDYNWDDVVPDLNGEKKIQAAIIGWGKDSVYTYNKHTLYTDLKNYDVLIDAAALLRKIEDPLTVVSRWAEEEKDPNTIYVFINKDHLPQEYSLGAKAPYKTYKYKKGITFKYYFDQKHTLGTNLKLPSKAKALTLVKANSKLTDVAQAIFRMRGIAPESQTTDFAFKSKKEEAKNIPTSRKDLYTLFYNNDQKYKENLLPRHYVQNIKTVYREENKNTPVSYTQDVPYYTENIQLPSLKTDFGQWLLKKGQDYIKVADNTIGVQYMQEYARENNVELEIKHQCPSRSEFEVKIEDYDNVDWGYLISNTDIRVSYAVLLEIERGLQEKNLCFIHYNSGYCKIITLSEYLFLQTREFKLDDAEFVFAHSTMQENETPTFYLSLAICGRYLGIYEQLIIIKNITIDPLKEIIHCFYMDRFDVIVDYITSGKSGRQYLANFTRDCNIFLEKWIRWNTKSDVLLAYWEKCKRVLDSK